MRRTMLLAAAVMTAVALVLFWPVTGEDRRPGGFVARFAPPLGMEDAVARPIITPEFLSPVDLRANNRQILATGPLACEVGEKWRVDVEITQADATAKGHTQGHCSGRTGTWTVRAVARGPAEFQTGDARGCGTFTTRKGSSVSGSIRWCQDLVLEPAG